MPPAINIQLAPPSNNWTGDVPSLFNLIAANISAALPAGFLTGYAQSATPPDNSGPWLDTTSNIWKVWDAASSSYKPMATGHEVGMIGVFAFTGFDITRWLACDGSAIPRVAPYDTLFSRIGSTFGAGDGATTFNLPDLRGQGILGAGSVAAPLTTIRNLNDHSSYADTPLTAGAGGAVTIPVVPWRALQLAIRY